MLRICQFGAGRIGAIHAANIAANPRTELLYVVDVDRSAASQLAARFGAEAMPGPAEALSDPRVDAVVIASSTDTHVDLATAASLQHKAIFCEKPVDLDLKRAERCVAEVAAAGVPFFLGFNRRFDPSFRALHDALRAGEVGRLESVLITSRDPSPPPMEYVAVSGGLFRDMMIHDFDMARWLLDEEPSELFALASCLVDPAIGEAGDVDTAMVTMRTAGGILVQISNSRRATYGYDQRVEVLGSNGMLQAGNRLATTVTRWSEAGVRSDPVEPFFVERYAESYAIELEAFVAALLDGAPLSPSAEDGRNALALAEAAERSIAEKGPIALHLPGASP